MKVWAAFSGKQVTDPATLHTFTCREHMGGTCWDTHLALKGWQVTVLLG